MIYKFNNNNNKYRTNLNILSFKKDIYNNQALIDSNSNFMTKTGPHVLKHIKKLIYWCKQNILSQIGV